MNADESVAGSKPTKLYSEDEALAHLAKILVIEYFEKKKYEQARKSKK